MRTSFLVLFLCAASLSSLPARAQLYKWVDESGVTHYSDRAPKAVDATLVPERISVYQPDPALVRAMSAPKPDRKVEDRVAALERRLQQERRNREDTAAYAAAAQKAAFDQCVEERRVDCDQPGAYQGYGPPVVVVGGRRRPVAPAIAAQPITGRTAGAVTTTGGIMPGTFNGPEAITAGNVVTFAPRASSPRASQGSRLR